MWGFSRNDTAKPITLVYDHISFDQYPVYTKSFVPYNIKNTSYAELINTSFLFLPFE